MRAFAVICARLRGFCGVLRVVRGCVFGLILGFAVEKLKKTLGPWTPLYFRAASRTPHPGAPDPSLL